MANEVAFKGYAVHDTSKWSEFKLIDFPPKTFIDDDVEVKIECCGVCGSDLHTISGGWGKPILPVIVGHEIIGTVTRVGSKVSEFKPGDRVGVGAQIWCCNKPTCPACRTDNENYCPKKVDTYNSKYPSESGVKDGEDLAWGGYSTAIRAHQRFVVKIPDSLESVQAAPMLCGGLTVYSPLVRNGAGPGKRVGVVGVGGLGHYAIQFAKALGAEVTVFSHSSRKKEDALKMGADQFVVTGEKGFHEGLQMNIDLMIVTANVADGLHLNELLSTLTIQGRLIMVALPNDQLPPLAVGPLIATGCLIGGSHIGSKKEATEMLELAAQKGVKSWVEIKNMSQAGEALTGVNEGKVRYRYVLLNDISV